MTETAEAITRIIEAYGERTGQWVRLAEIAKLTGLSREELAMAMLELIGDEDFRIEPEPLWHRVTKADRAVQVKIGGEYRHLIMWL